MTDPVLWWSIASGAVLLELLSGTFYLLMLAIGFAAGAVAAHLGFSSTTQLFTVSVVASGATYAWHRLRLRNPGLRASADKGVELDVGETVNVPAWEKDFTARVQYRGTVWTAELEGQSVQRADIAPGTHEIMEVRGNNLIVRPHHAKQGKRHPWS